ncbi:hypothetical protein QQS21_009987 [Conoideocrella luteorostrata]|uniref:Uncharacterized protein n=1 Tax=Conoideocrella luteorostrata TaxID=1105319 RepID=A0AAJ0CG42_9HYPO|nr:hypothetical protein QQS21_009987 [Conoideocrella luteorostrata]
MALQAMLLTGIRYDGDLRGINLQHRLPRVRRGVQKVHRNAEATAEGITPDGWFRTGNQATIDAEGSLNLVGRVNDVINLNGTKIICTDMQSWLEQTLTAQVNRAIVFPSRAADERTEKVTIAYSPNMWPIHVEGTAQIHDQAVDASMAGTGHRSLIFLVGDASMLPQPTLGKISRASMTSLFGNDAYAKMTANHDKLLYDDRAKTSIFPLMKLRRASQR